MKLDTGVFCLAILSLLPTVAQSSRLGGKRVKNGRNDYFEVLEAEELDAFALTFDQEESAEFWIRHLQASSSLTVLPTPPPTTMTQPLPQPTSQPPSVQAQPQPSPPPTIVAQPEPQPTSAPTILVIPQPQPTAPPTVPLPQPQPTPPPTMPLPKPQPTQPPTVPLPQPQPTSPPTMPLPKPQPTPQPTPPPTTAVPQPQPTPPPTTALPQPTQPPTTVGVDLCAAVTCTNPIEGCDPLDGLCKPVDAVVPCIAVIDESSQSDSYITGLWDTFRAQYPYRPFCLLRPVSDSVSDRLYLPPSFVSDARTTFANVSRDSLGDQSVVPGISDWFNICGFGIYKGSDIQYIGKFLDTSGSMKLSTVEASNDLFVANVRSAGLEIREVFNGFEDWITPFLTTLVPSSGRRQALRRSHRKQ